MRKHSGTTVERKFNCRFCDHNSVNMNALEAHLRTHLKEKPHKCQICEKEFSESHSLKGHMNIHSDKHKERNFNCSLCPKSFRTVRDVKIHVTNVHSEVRPFPCTHCPLKFKTKSHLKEHVQRLHNGDAKQFPCSKCKKSFKTRSDMRVHSLTHTDLRNFKCLQCNGTYKTKQVLNMHVKFSHGVTKKYKCDLCTSILKSKSALTYHKTVHSNLKPYKCDLCTSTFSCVTNVFDIRRACMLSGKTLPVSSVHIPANTRLLLRFTLNAGIIPLNVFHVACAKKSIIRLETYSAIFKTFMRRKSLTPALYALNPLPWSIHWPYMSGFTLLELDWSYMNVTFAKNVLLQNTPWISTFEVTLEKSVTNVSIVVTGVVLHHR